MTSPLRGQVSFIIGYQMKAGFNWKAPVNGSGSTFSSTNFCGFVLLYKDCSRWCMESIIGSCSLELRRKTHLDPVLAPTFFKLDTNPRVNIHPVVMHADWLYLGTVDGKIICYYIITWNRTSGIYITSMQDCHENCIHWWYDGFGVPYSAVVPLIRRWLWRQ